MHILILVLGLISLAGPAYGQIITHTDGESSSGGGGFSAPAKYKIMERNIGCGKDLEYTNIHLRNVNGPDAIVSTSKTSDCNIVLRDCRIDGAVIADNGNITLERCEVHGGSFALWANGKGSITLIDSVVYSKRTSVLIQTHATGNVNLIRSKLKGGRTDIRGKGRIIRSKSVPTGVVIPKPKWERIPRKGFTFQPVDLKCARTGTNIHSNLHFDRRAMIIGGDCDLVINGCILDSERASVIVRNGNITLRGCEIRGGTSAIRLTGSGSVTLIDSTISSPEDAVISLYNSTGNVMLTRSKILKGKVNMEGTGKIIR